MYDHVLHMTLEKCIKQIHVPSLVFTKLYHVRSSGMVKVFALYPCKLKKVKEGEAVYDKMHRNFGEWFYMMSTKH